MTLPIRLLKPEGEPAGSSGSVAPTMPAPAAAPSSNPFVDVPITPAATPPAPGSGDSRQPDGSRGPAAPASSPTSAPPQTPGAGIPPSGSPQTPDSQGRGSAPVVPPAPPTVTLTPEQFRELAAGRAPANPQQPQVSDAELAKRFNIFTADAGTYRNLFGVDPDSPERIQHLNTVLQSVAKQAFTVADYRAEQRINAIIERFAPFEAQMKRQQEETYKTEFYTTHPDLKDSEPLLKEIVDAARSRGMTFPSVKEAMQYVAQQARTILGKHLPPAGAAPGSTPAQPSPAPVARPMTPVSMGGQNGAGGSATPPVSTSKRIFGS